MKFIIMATILIAIVFFESYKYLATKPPYLGTFNWTKVAIKDQQSPDMVFESPMRRKQIFSLENGDECFYLNEEQWTWRDSKDLSPLVPILCPAKGAGWAWPPSN